MIEEDVEFLENEVYDLKRAVSYFARYITTTGHAPECQKLIDQHLLDVVEENKIGNMRLYSTEELKRMEFLAKLHSKWNAFDKVQKIIKERKAGKTAYSHRGRLDGFCSCGYIEAKELLPHV